VSERHVDVNVNVNVDVDVKFHHVDTDRGEHI